MPTQPSGEVAYNDSPQAVTERTIRITLADDGTSVLHFALVLSEGLAALTGETPEWKSFKIRVKTDRQLLATIEAIRQHSAESFGLWLQASGLTAKAAKSQDKATLDPDAYSEALDKFLSSGKQVEVLPGFGWNKAKAKPSEPCPPSLTNLSLADIFPSEVFSE